MAKKPGKAKASTQEHLDIDDIVDDLVLLKTGWVACVMSTTAVNFDLLSEAEQDATIYAFGAFLNSLSFPLEILIRSKKADITSYFQSLEEAEVAQPNPDIKRQIQKYKDFIQSTVQQKTVLDKKFYFIINFSPVELGLKGGLSGKKAGAGSKSQLLTDAKTALAPKRDHIIKQTSRLGLTTKQLTTQELIELFYDIYNPAPTGTQRVLLDTDAYTTPLVEPAVEVPIPAPVQIPQQPAPPPSPLINPVQEATAPVSGLDLRQKISPIQEPSAPELRPVDPRPQVAPPPNLAPHQARPPTTAAVGSVGQAEALKNLQAATSQAAQFTQPAGGQANRPTPNPTINQNPNVKTENYN